MIGTNRLPRRILWVLLGVFLISLPACQSPQGQTWGGVQQQPPDSSNLVYRPILSLLERPRPMYLSNYAGDDESPTRPRRNRNGVPMMIAPESPPQVTIQQGSWDGE